MACLVHATNTTARVAGIGPIGGEQAELELRSKGVSTKKRRKFCGPCSRGVSAVQACCARWFPSPFTQQAFTTIPADSGICTNITHANMQICELSTLLSHSHFFHHAQPANMPPPPAYFERHYYPSFTTKCSASLLLDSLPYMTVHSRISHVHRHFPALLAIVGRYILTATRETLLHSALETQRSAAVIVSRSILDLKELHGLGQLLLDLDLGRTLERGSRV